MGVFWFFLESGFVGGFRVFPPEPGDPKGGHNEDNEYHIMQNL